MNEDWLARALAQLGDDVADHLERARAIFAALEGAQLVARSRGDALVYEGIIATYMSARLLP